MDQNKAYPSAQSAGGVRSRAGKGAVGPVGRPGPVPPGLSRLRPRQPMTPPPGVPPLLPVIASSGGVRARAGRGAIGQIGRPGPGPPGLSRLRPRQPMSTPTPGGPLAVAAATAVPGTLAEAGQAATVALTGTNTPPAVAGTLAGSAQPGTVALVGTVTPPATTVTLAEAGQAATVALAAVNTPPAITSTLAEQAQAATGAFAGTNTPPAVTSALAEAGQAATVVLVATNTPPAITSTLAEQGQAGTVAFAGTVVPPATTLTLAELGQAAVESYSAIAASGIVATLAGSGQAAIVALAGTNTPPAVTSALASQADRATVAFQATAALGTVATLAESAGAASAALAGTVVPPATLGTLAEVAGPAAGAMAATGMAPAVKPPAPVLQAVRQAVGLRYFAVAHEGAGTTLHDLATGADDAPVPAGIWGVGLFSGPDLAIDGQLANIVVLPSPTPFNRPGDFSVSCWVKLTSNASQIFAATYTNYDPAIGATDDGWNVGCDDLGSGKVKFYTRAYPAAADVLLSAAPLTIGAWHHLAFTFDAATGTKRIYLDGSLAAIGPPGIAPPAYDAIMHATVGGAVVWDLSSSFQPTLGALDAVAVYDYALPASGDVKDSVAGIHADPFVAVRAAVAPPPPTAVVAPYRDYQFLRLLAGLLDATGEFDEVRTGGLPELRGASAAADRLACLELAGWEDRDNYDDPESTPQIRTVHYWLHLLVRAEDPDLRDDELDRLLAVSVNTLNGVALGAASYPNKSRLVRGHWLDAAGPERRMKVAGQFVYEVDDYSLHSII